jgi:flavin reductase (DIM6/NTAB) family NADH-FMN oxidoreductase RutF
MKQDIGAKLRIYPTPVLVVATYDLQGKPNAMTAAWGGICCSVPPCVTISLRKATYTFGNLMENKAFTINIPSGQYLKEADYFGIASGRDADKFLATGLTAVRSGLVNAPYIEEFPICLECKVIHVTELGLHTQFIGEVLNTKVDATLLENGEPLIEQIKPFLFAPDTRSYYAVGNHLAQAFAIGKEIK